MISQGLSLRPGVLLLHQRCTVKFRTSALTRVRAPLNPLLISHFHGIPGMPPTPTFIEPRSVLKLSASAIPAIRRPSDPQRQVASPSQPAPFSRWGSTSESSAGRICTAVASVIAKYADHRVYNLLFTLVSGKSSHMSPELRRSIGDNHCAVAACISKAARLCGCTSAFV